MKKQGFTLIELMIVVAIIGVLAAIAMPIYQKYISKTQLNRLHSEISRLKTKVELYVNRGELNFSEIDIGWRGSNLADTSDGPHPVANDGLSLLNWSVPNDGYGQLKVIVGNDATLAISGIVIYLEREQSGIWSCQIEKSLAPVWSASYLPGGCTLLSDGTAPIDD